MSGPEVCDDWRSVLTEAADRVVGALESLSLESWGDETGWGADGTITAAADAVAERAALTYFADAIPGVGLCSEEAGVTAGDADVLLIVDPVDGTNNAVLGIPYWAFAAGVVVDGEPKGALVRNIPAGIDYFAWKGDGADVDGRPARSGNVSRLQDATVLLQRPAEPAALDKAVALMASAELPRIMGAAALDIAAVGAGSAQVYANPNSLGVFGEKVVDYAAAAIFAETAGAVVTDNDGAELSFEPDLTSRTRVVAAATPVLHEAVLDLLANRDSA